MKQRGRTATKPAASLLLLAIVGGSAHGQQNHPHQAHEHQQQDVTTAVTAPDAFVSPHVPPAAPTHVMPPMSAREMNEIMAMDDAARYGKFMFNEAEWADDGSLAWDVDAWYGGDLNKLWVRSDGLQGVAHESFSVDVLWDRAFARWWNVQAGMRVDAIESESRASMVIGLRGLAPQWFELESSLYLRDNGVLTLHGEVDYELLLTQRLVLQPALELTANSKEDAPRAAGSGLAEIEVGLRLRYEIQREFAPYIGLEWVRSFGDTSDFARAAGRDASTLKVVAGLRAWF